MSFRKELVTNLKEINIKGYVYSMWSGKLTVHEGYLLPNYKQDYGRFYKMRKDVIIGTLQCSNDPGYIANSVVWLEERDDQKVIDLLIQYELDQIEKCKERIENHEAKIEMLKKAVL